MLERVFKLRANGTNVKTEVVAGITTFMTMAYILAVNPSILGDAGMDATAVLLATALASFIGTALMALTANKPFALSAGMGLNAYPGDGEVAVDLQNIVVQLDLDQFFLGTLGLQTQDTVTLDAQIEQALAAGNSRGEIGPGNSLMLQLGLAGQEQTVIQNNGATPVSSVDQQDMLVSRLQDQRAVAGILGLDGRFTGDTSAQGLTEQIAYTLNAGSRIHIAHGPLHGARLQSDVGLGHIADDLTLTYIHLIAVVSDHGIAGHDAQITRVLHYCEGAKLVDNIDIIVVSKVLDLVHGYYHLSKNGSA